MKITYKELMNKMGVGRPLNIYETQPWMTSDCDEGIICEGEVRCNHDKTIIEAELQFIYDIPPEGKPPVEQICLITAVVDKGVNSDYGVIECIIRGEAWKNKFYDWESKSCNFFRACVREVKADRIPDIDKILEKEMKEGGFYGRNQGDGSNKSPLIKTNQLIHDMKGGGQGF